MLLPALYLSIAHKQPAPLHCSLLQQVVSAVTSRWLPTDSPCWPLPTLLPSCCPRHQASASRECQLMLSILLWCTACTGMGLPHPAGTILLLQDHPASSSLWKLLSPCCSKVEHTCVLSKYHTTLLAGAKRERALWRLWKERGR